MATKQTINLNGILTEVWQTDASAQEIDDAVVKANNAVKKSGDTMTGDLYLGGGFSRITSTANQIQIEARKTVGSTNNRRLFNLYNENTRSFDQVLGITEVDSEGKTSASAYVLHTGNKPSGSYTGNGSATERTINVGGTGGIIHIVGNGYNGILMSSGGVFVQYTGTLKGIPNASFKYRDGVITIATDDAAANANGVTYYYQVL